MQDFTTSKLPAGLRSFPVQALIGIIVLFALFWIVVGLISLRFSLATSLADVAYSQLIIVGCLLVGLANGYVMQSGGFNREGEGPVWRILAYSPVASAGTAIIGMLLLIWPVWTSFSSIEPNRLLQVMFTLITIGLCGTFAGFVSLAEVGRIYRYLSWGLYVLIVALAVEIGESLWRVERLQAGSTGEQAGMIGAVVVTATVVYAIVAVLMANAGTERSRTIALIWYFIAGIGGFTIGVWALWDSLEAGPHRLVLGLAMILCIGAVGLALLHYYNRRAPRIRSQAESPVDPGLVRREREAPVSNPAHPYSPNNPYTPYGREATRPASTGEQPAADPADPYSPNNPYTPYGREATRPASTGEQPAADPAAYSGSSAGGDQSVAPGTPAPAEVATCPGCGNLNLPTANFCRLCGLRLAKE